MSGDPTSVGTGFVVHVPWREQGVQAKPSGFRIDPGTPLSDVLTAASLLGVDEEVVKSLSGGNGDALEKARHNVRHPSTGKFTPQSEVPPSSSPHPDPPVSLWQHRGAALPVLRRRVPESVEVLKETVERLRTRRA
jgi:hypothetical protein